MTALGQSRVANGTGMGSEEGEKEFPIRLWSEHNPWGQVSLPSLGKGWVFGSI